MSIFCGQGRKEYGVEQANNRPVEAVPSKGLTDGQTGITRVGYRDASHLIRIQIRFEECV